MTIRMKAVLIGMVAAVAALSAPAAMAEDPLTAYTYYYYADAAKTEFLGTVSDQGCEQSGNVVNVIRAQVPTPYYDLEPMYICTTNGPYRPPEW